MYIHTYMCIFVLGMRYLGSVQGTAKVVSFCVVFKKSAAEQCFAEYLFLASRKLNAGFVMMFCF